MTSTADLLAGAELLRLQPGDTLVIHLADDRGLALRDVAELRERIKAHLPDNKVVILAADTVRVEAPKSTGSIGGETE